MSDAYVGGKGDKVRPGKGFREGYAEAFGPAKKVKGCARIWCPTIKKMVDKPVKTNSNQSALVMKPLEAFVSPIDKTLITDRGQLRRHNKEHGVTDARDYSPETMQKHADKRYSEINGASRAQQKELSQHINEVMRHQGV